MNRYYKTFILCGDIDQYCLLCKESFYLILDIEKHIRWEKHLKNVKEQTCLRQFKADLVYKIQSNYYCAICNLVMKNLSAVKKHVKTDKHELLKREPNAIKKKPAGQIRGGFVIIDDVVLDKNEWNAVKDSRCYLCSIDLENSDLHIESEEHMIRLIQSTTKYTDKQYYRKIDGETYHCFGCKNIVKIPNFVDHWIRCDHTLDSDKQKLEEIQNQPIATDGGEGPSKMVNIEKDLIDTMIDYFDVNEETQKARCRDCPTTLNADFRTMLNHLKDFHENTYSDYTLNVPILEDDMDTGNELVRDSGLRRLELANYGKKIYIRMNHNGSQGYCKLCDTYISASKSQFNLHCRGMCHQGYLEIIGIKKAVLCETSETYSWQRFKAYILNIENAASEPAFWVNDKYCIDIDSFFYLYSIQGDPHYKFIKCLACFEVMYPEEVIAHCNTMKHRLIFIASKFLEIEGEFIREIRPCLFHCGFCNRTVTHSKLLERHFKTKLHKTLKQRKTLSNVDTIIRMFHPSKIDLNRDEYVLYDNLLRIAGICVPSTASTTTF